MMLFNGMFIGTVNDGNKFVKQIRKKKRESTSCSNEFQKMKE